MAFDKIEPPDLWESASTRMLYQLVCAWAGDKPPAFASFFPRRKVEPMSEEQILAAFGIRT